MKWPHRDPRVLRGRLHAHLQLTESRLDLAAILADLLGGDRSQAEDVLSRLFEADVLNHVLVAVRAALRSADAAWSERPDLYDNPAQPDVGADVAIAAVARALSPLTGDRQPPPQHLAAQVARLRYKEWSFRLVLLPGVGPAVEVQARLDNTFHAGAPFSTGRRAAIIDGDVVGAAYRAVLLVEAHEAAERLSLDDRVVLDPHAASAVPAPDNLRS